MKQPVTAVLNTKNAEKTLQRTLESLAFCDEIVVVDMESSDKTVAIAKHFTKHVYQHQDVGYVEPARNFAINKAVTDWVLIVDSDEVVPEQLAKKIKELVSSKAEIACYFIARKNIIFGKWIEKTGWWPDFQPRLLLKDKVEWKDAVHSTPKISGNIEYLPADPDLALTHYNYESVSDYLQRLDRYTSIAVQDDAQTSFSAKGVVAAFRNELMRRLFKENGVEDGIHGVGLSFLQSMYQLVMYLKAWEKHKSGDQTQTAAETMAELEVLNKDISYWIANYYAKKTSGTSQMVWKIRRKFKI